MDTETPITDINKQPSDLAQPNLSISAIVNTQSSLPLSTDAKIAETNIYLSSSNKRKASTRQYQRCPICHKQILQSKLEEHYEYELEMINSTNSPIGTTFGRTTRVKSGTTGSDTSVVRSVKLKLEAVRKSRSKRTTKRNAKGIFSSSSGPSGSDERTEYTCCVCQNVIMGSLNDMNAHVDQCLNSAAAEIAGDEGQEEEFEEYECGGITRVRVMSGVDAPLESLGYYTNKRTEDVDEDLDVDGDDSEVFGENQYVNEDLKREFEDDDEEEELDVDMADAGGDFLIEALKARIKQLEKKEKATCLICMDSYKTPLTSIACWHVHCEKCWLTCLAGKKVCPQCNVITTPQNLRRIYL